MWDCGLRIVNTARSEGERERRRESGAMENVGRRKESVLSLQVHLKYKLLSTGQFACAKDFISTSLVAKGASIVYYKKMFVHNQ